MSEFKVGDDVEFGSKRGVIEGFFEAAIVRDADGLEYRASVDELIKVNPPLEEGDRVRAYCQNGTIASGPFRSPKDDDRYVILLDDGSHVLCSDRAIKKL